jgi:hypothetical protein
MANLAWLVRTRNCVEEHPGSSIAVRNAVKAFAVPELISGRGTSRDACARVWQRQACDLENSVPGPLVNDALKGDNLELFAR